MSTEPNTSQAVSRQPPAGPAQPAPPTSPQPAMTLAQPTPPAPAVVEEARASLARFRKIMFRTGGVFGAALAAATLATEPISWCLSAASLGIVSLAYRFPPTRRIRRARAVMRGWESMELLQARPDTPSGSDPRLAAADAVIARLAEHAGADRRPVAFGQEVRQQLARVLDDRRAVEQLRDALSPAEAEARLAPLRTQVDDRIDRLMAALAEVYEALLAQDDATLGTVLARGEDLLRQVRARQEVERLLES